MVVSYAPSDDPTAATPVAVSREADNRKPAGETAAPRQAAQGPYFDRGTYLDGQQRYQLLENLTLTDLPTGVAVLDTQPDEPSPLIEAYAALPPSQRQALTADPSWLPPEIPAEAYPYLCLRENFFPSIPELQDAWVEGAYRVVVIEDRSALPRLLDAWVEADLDPLQQVHCLYTMTELWEQLAASAGQTSLLNLDNLCLDEDQILCLRQLDCQPGKTSHTLQDLGLLWQSLLNAGGHLVGPLADLASAVTLGAIATPAALKEQLVVIAESLQANPPVKTQAVECIDLPELLDPDEDDALNLSDATDIATMVLPMTLVAIEEAGQTHVGRQRDHNEDAYFIQSTVKKQDGIQGQQLEAHCLYLLCDGMGGHAGGEVASRLAVETLQQYFDQNWQHELPSEAQLQAAIKLANQTIYDLNQTEERAGNARMGTTLVMLLLHNTQAVIAHVGDSRLYRYSRRLGLQQLTVDHEVGQREIQRGVEPALAYARPDAYQLTQALGPRPSSELHPSITYLDFSEDTLLLLCSDGLSDHDLLESNCEHYLDPVLREPKNLEEGVSNLIDLANEVNGHDNITAVAVKLRVKPNLDKMRLG